LQCRGALLLDPAVIERRTGQAETGFVQQQPQCSEVRMVVSREQALEINLDPGRPR